MRPIKAFFTTFTICFSLIGIAQTKSHTFDDYATAQSIEEKISVAYRAYGYYDSPEDGDTLLWYVKDLKRLGSEEKNKIASALSMHILGYFLYRKQLYEEAEKKLVATIKYIKELDNDTLLVTPLTNLGNIFYLKGELGNAKLHYEKAIQVGKKSGIKKYEMLSILNLSKVYLANKDYATAFNLIEGYIDYHSKTRALLNLSWAHATLGEIYLNQKEMLKANDHLIKSMEYGLAVGGLNEIAHAYTNLGIVEFYSENYQRCEEYFRLALAYRIKDNDNYKIAESYYNIGDYFVGIEKFDSAFVNYNLAIEHATLGNHIGLKIETLEQKASLYEDLEQKDLQIETLKEIILQQKELNQANLQSNKALIDFNNEQNLYDYLEINSIREEELEGKVGRIQNIFSRWLLISLAAIPVVGGTIVYRKRKRKNNKL